MKSRLSAYLRLIRPHHWIKSGFVFTGLLFGHAWAESERVTQVAVAAIAFSLVSSAVYVTNDLLDRADDLRHPWKRWRPLAAGEVSVRSAVVLAAGLALAGLGLSLHASPRVLAIVAIYVAISLAYSLGLKHVVILDVFVLAAGFMLRILAGTVGVGIQPSPWLLLCGLMLTLFLGLAKRRAEIAARPDGDSAARRVLDHYSPVLLDKMIGVTAACTILAYSLYTMDTHTRETHGTASLIYTVPLVMYGIFRYIFLLHHAQRGEDPSTEILRDPHLLASILGWLALTWLLISL
jgi:4-hydroxybenzoate polyprenyltransferase